MGVQDLAELILAVHRVATDIPRRFRHRHDNVIDLVAATVSDVRPELAQRRYNLGRVPTVAFAVKQRGMSVDVVVEHNEYFARAMFYTRPTSETRWRNTLAAYTQHALLVQNIAATLS
ncbi:hypothetical protein C5E45_20170 [Nocardia nova]|uniref:Uncharacterized protein n=1 Tax=Nocardia nova TaxID=37330 RepID=A0A2S6AMA3_9NOCA|nr:hypothetical protein C5E45_20170 [Nocardia nova]